MFDDETEAETRADRINPVLAAAGWGVVEGSRLRQEIICPGRILAGGRRSAPVSSDYVLIYRGHKLATLEAKRAGLGHTVGIGQAKNYAERLGARFAYSSNGLKWYEVDMETGREGDIAPFPSPDELWRRVFAADNDWRDRFGAVEFETGGGKWQPRYYQHRAITAALEAIARGDTRILLTLATGTGKTGIAFQIAWKLFQSRWNLTAKPTRRPRILFLADRNILANQAYNAFSAFPVDALARINPREIAKKGGVPRNASVFFTIFQTFMTQNGETGGEETEEQAEPEFRFEGYEKDFFDFIIIDECHRGGAKDESTWRGILNYFSPAVQLGMTATPKRDANADTYRYFGEPAYVYALKEGIEDGFLTPFKVRQMASTIDEYVFTSDDTVVAGEIDEGRRYVEGDFNTEIVMEEREMSRVAEFMKQIDQRHKTLVFCANQAHAARVRDFINQVKTSTDTNYCQRVTAEDGDRGEAWLGAFQDNEKTIPTILTTSHKLSTGVDALNVRNIVLMRPIKSMIEFKQIIGRGTRVFDGKDFFTIYDFVKAYQHFSDPEWDGEPLEPVAPTPKKPRAPKEPDGMEAKGREFDEPPVEKVVVKLGDGKARKIQYIATTSYWLNGKVVSAREFIERLYGDLSSLVIDEDALRRTWSDPETRTHFLKQLEEKGFGARELSDIRRLIDAQDSDIFDVLAYVRFAMAPKLRVERAANARRTGLKKRQGEMREFLEGVLSAYEKSGVDELSLESLPALLTVKYGGLSDAKARLGELGGIRRAFVGIQADIYRK